MQNMGNVYIWGSPFVMSRTDAQNGVDIIFNEIETKDLCTLRYNSTSNKVLIFCGFEVRQASRPSYLTNHGQTVSQYI
jgi:hypothetical protein